MGRPAVRSLLLVLMLVGPLLASPRLGGAQVGSSDTADAQAAAAAAVAISQLEATRNYDAVYDRMHPDAQAIIPRAVIIGWYRATYADQTTAALTVTGVRFVDWTWPVTGKTYPHTAEVSFVQPYWDSDGTEHDVTDVERLVQVGTDWDWFFGRSRDFVQEQMATYAPGMVLPGPSAPPTTAPPSGGSGPSGTTPMSEADLITYLQQAEADITGFWQRTFPAIAHGTAYTPPPRYQAYDQPITTPCGPAMPGQEGPFWCGRDDVIYLDLVFLQQLASDFGRFPVAAVVAHETGHHVQALLHLQECAASPCLDPSERTSTAIETMADCFAGAWAKDAAGRGLLGSFDIERDVAAYVLAFGDQGPTAAADPGAHGQGALRTYWLLTGFYNGAPVCLADGVPTSPGASVPPAHTTTGT